MLLLRASKMLSHFKRRLHVDIITMSYAWNTRMIIFAFCNHKILHRREFYWYRTPNSILIFLGSLQIHIASHATNRMRLNECFRSFFSIIFAQKRNKTEKHENKEHGKCFVRNGRAFPSLGSLCSLLPQYFTNALQEYGPHPSPEFEVPLPYYALVGNHRYILNTRPSHYAMQIWSQPGTLPVRMKCQRVPCWTNKIVLVMWGNNRLWMKDGVVVGWNNILSIMHYRKSLNNNTDGNLHSCSLLNLFNSEKSNTSRSLDGSSLRGTREIHATNFTLTLGIGVIILSFRYSSILLDIRSCFSRYPIRGEMYLFVPPLEWVDEGMIMPPDKFSSDVWWVRSITHFFRPSLLFIGQLGCVLQFTSFKLGE